MLVSERWQPTLDKLRLRIDGWRAFADRSPAVKVASNILRFAFFFGIVIWLTLKVDAIGWRNVLGSMPLVPAFYLLFAVRFFTLPLSEMFAFNLLFEGRRPRPSLGLFLKKRVYNNAFIGYSGDIYFFVWAKNHLDLSKRRLLLLLKDNAVLSAAAALVATAVLVALFMNYENLDLVALESTRTLLWAGGITLLGFLAIPVIVALSGQIITTKARTAWSVFGIHLARVGIVLLLQALQWAVVLPEEPLSVWIFFLTMQMLISRLGFIPNRELLFLGAALELSQVSIGPREKMAALMLASGALTQALNLFFYVYVSLSEAWSRRNARQG